MTPVAWTNLTYFVSLTLLAWVIPLDNKRRRKITGIGTMGVTLTLFSLVPPPEVRDWTPVPLMLLAYWQSGPFFVRPHAELQSRLASIDRRVLPVFQRLSPVWLSAYFEFAYFFCYPLVPLGLGALYSLGLHAHANAYWLAVLPASYLCYGLLPFFQTLPPRLIEDQPVQQGRMRAVNLWVLGWGSNGVNTFPSAHVASCTAASLFLLSVTPVGWVFLAVSASIAMGAFLGRYHYAADAVAGAALALALFLL